MTTRLPTVEAEDQRARERGGAKELVKELKPSNAMTPYWTSPGGINYIEKAHE